MENAKAAWEFAVLTAKGFWVGWTGTSVLVVALLIYERVKGTPASWPIYISVFVGCLVAALFRQGVKQHIRLRRRIIIRNLTRRVWPAERHGFTGAEYYIEIFNPSEAEPLENVRVELLRMEPDVIGLSRVPLHIKYDDYESREFSVNPGTARLVDIITGPTDAPRSQIEMIVPHTVNAERFPIPRGRYRLTIQASARNVKAQKEDFQVWIDDPAGLQCVHIPDNS